jgi:hypothetical protein
VIDGRAGHNRLGIAPHGRDVSGPTLHPKRTYSLGSLMKTPMPPLGPLGIGIASPMQMLAA